MLSAGAREVIETAVKQGIQQSTEQTIKGLSKELIEAGIKNVAEETIQRAVKETLEKVAQEAVEKAVKNAAADATQATIQKAASEAAEETMKKFNKEVAEGGLAAAARRAGLPARIMQGLKQTIKLSIPIAITGYLGYRIYEYLKKKNYRGNITSVKQKESNRVEVIHSPGLKISQSDKVIISGSNSTPNVDGTHEKFNANSRTSIILEKTITNEGNDGELRLEPAGLIQTTLDMLSGLFKMLGIGDAVGAIGTYIQWALMIISCILCVFLAFTIVTGN